MNRDLRRDSAGSEFDLHRRLALETMNRDLRRDGAGSEFDLHRWLALETMNRNLRRDGAGSEFDFDLARGNVTRDTCGDGLDAIVHGGLPVGLKGRLHSDNPLHLRPTRVDELHPFGWQYDDQCR